MSDQGVIQYITIMERTFKVKCPLDEVDDLFAAVETLKQTMQQVQGGGTSASLETLAVISALNLAQELTRSSKIEPAVSEQELRQLQRIDDKISQTLADY